MAEPMLPGTSFKVIAGSYEKLLYGLEGTITPSDLNDYTFSLNPIFIFPAHVSCIKSVAASPVGGKWLATGSADEIIKVWDLRRKKEIGGLMHHEGSITHLTFPSRSHLLSASEDGTLCLFRARDWAVLRSLKGHKGRVNSVAVHPSSKVALSVGKDKTLRMWDLMRGKGSASTKLGKEGELVRWNTSGTLFAVQAQTTIDLYSTKMELIQTITHPSRLHDIKFCKPVNVNQNENSSMELLLAAAEDQKVSIYSVPDNPNADETEGNADDGKSKEREEGCKRPLINIIAEMVGHTNRVKAVETLEISLPPSSFAKKTTKRLRTTTTIISTISSDGKIFLYDLAALPALPSPSHSKSESSSSQTTKIQLTPKAEYDTKGTRLTCLTLADGEVVSGSVNGKRKRTTGDDKPNKDVRKDLHGEDEDDEARELSSGAQHGEGEDEDEGEAERD